MIDFFIHAMIGLAILVFWETLGLREAWLHLLGKAKRWRNWKRFFDIKGEIVLTTSVVQVNGAKEAARRPDVIVEQSLRQKLGVSARYVEADDRPLAFPNLREHQVVIGSTRYSQQARAIQFYYELPYEYVYDYVQADPPRQILKITSSHGQEYVSSVDIRLKVKSRSVDYGFLFLSELPSGKRIYWLSGIHGAGTLGVAKYLLKNPDRFLAEQPSTSAWARQWLFRIEYDPHAKESYDMVQKVDVVRGPEECVPRRRDRAIRAVISDFGNVLMTFDRDRTHRALGHLCGRPYGEIAKLIEASGDRDKYERGDLTDQEFYERIRTLVGPATMLEFETFAEWWGDIFWENRNMVELFRMLSKQLPLVLLSNTNNLHFASVREHYGDVISLFRSCILSYEERRSKPAPELFLRAVTSAGAGIRPEECVYIDDNPDYVEAAEAMGMFGCTYHDYPMLVRDLRRAGLDLV